MKRLIATTALGTMALAGAAQAATEAMATTDLNLRAGPGPNYEVVDVIANEGMVMIDGCVAESNWCKVSYDGNEGWAYGSYLTASAEGNSMVVVENRDALTVNTVTAEEVTAAGAGATIGALAGSLVFGPVGTAAAAIVAGAATEAQVPEETVTYVQSNSVEPVYLDGEVVVGAGVPVEVETYTIPDSEYAYVNVNGVPSIIEPNSRQIVYIVR